MMSLCYTATAASDTASHTRSTVAAEQVPVVAMGFIPESVRVMGARASETGLSTWEKTKDRYVEVSQIVREDLRGWLVCLAVLVITVVRSGITYSFGMFVVKLQEEFPDMT